jgi:hypothetical protein
MLLRLMDSLDQFTDVPMAGATLSVERTTDVDHEWYYVDIVNGGQHYGVGGWWTYMEASRYCRMLAARGNHPSGRHGR